MTEAKLLFNNLNIEAFLAIPGITETEAVAVIYQIVTNSINEHILPTYCADLVCVTLEIGTHRFHKQVQDFIEPFFDSVEVKSTNDFSETFNSPAYGKFAK